MRRRKCSFLRNKRQTAAHRSSFLVQILCTSRYRGTIKKQTKKKRKYSTANTTMTPSGDWSLLKLEPIRHRAFCSYWTAWAGDDTRRQTPTFLPLDPNRMYNYSTLHYRKQLCLHQTWSSVPAAPFFLLKALNISIVVLQKLGVCLAT